MKEREDVDPDIREYVKTVAARTNLSLDERRIVAVTNVLKAGCPLQTSFPQNSAQLSSPNWPYHGLLHMTGHGEVSHEQ